MFQQCACRLADFSDIERSSNLFSTISLLQNSNYPIRACEFLPAKYLMIVSLG